GINTWLEPEEAIWVIYINDESAEDYASAELRDFLSNPSDAKYLDASWNKGSTQTLVLEKNDAPGIGLAGFWHRAGNVTRSFVLISIAITALTTFGTNVELTRWLTIADLYTWQGQLSEISSGQLWRLVTPIFLHFMLLHILFNMMWLWDLGGEVEKKQGSLFLLFFILSIGILSNLVQYFSTGPAFGGMSGVVYALLGFVWMRSRKAGTGYHLNSGILGLMIVWLILGFTGIIGPIGNAAHLSGLLFGVAYGLGWNNYE
ncbi:MAG: rhomboid family intramembrane serine protease, partial [Enterobacterales bacterium]|nr:rhomboid family intramembrane serine protease [Enterobacterales bacterium]